MSNKSFEKNTPIDEIQQNKERRRLLKKGAAGAALITTISSKSVWATTGNCTVSGALSGNLSNSHSSVECKLMGYSHGSWKHPTGNGEARWNFVKKYYAFTEDSTIAKLFTGHALSSALSAIQGDSIMTALKPRGSAKGLAKQQIAAALNAYLFAALKIAFSKGQTNFSSIVDKSFYYERKTDMDRTVEDALSSTLDWILKQSSEYEVQGGSSWAF